MLAPWQATDAEVEKALEPLKETRINLGFPTRVTESSRDLSGNDAKGGRVEMKNDVDGTRHGEAEVAPSPATPG